MSPLHRHRRSANMSLSVAGLCSRRVRLGYGSSQMAAAAPLTTSCIWSMYRPASLSPATGAGRLSYASYHQWAPSLHFYRRGSTASYVYVIGGVICAVYTEIANVNFRPNDNSKHGFNEWAFMSTHMWGEYSAGEWILEVENGYRACKSIYVSLPFHSVACVNVICLSLSLSLPASLTCLSLVSQCPGYSSTCAA